MGDQVKGRSPKKLKSLIEAPNAVHVKVHVLNFWMLFLSSHTRIPGPYYLFLKAFLRNVKESFTEKLGTVNGVSQVSQRESTCSRLQYVPNLISVACSYTELSISGKIWAIR